ncbi:MAG: nucleotide exchange factor GrpE [Pseudonocardiaceae bacterium]
MSEDLDRDGMQKILDMLDYSTELSEQRAEHRREMSGLLLSLLDVMDSFDRLLGEDPGAAEVGVTRTCRLIARQLNAALEDVGVRATHPVGAAVDPRVHQVVAVQPAPASRSGIVVEVIQRGYEWHGGVLRPAQVIIGRSGEEDSG